MIKIWEGKIERFFGENVNNIIAGKSSQVKKGSKFWLCIWMNL